MLEIDVARAHLRSCQQTLRMARRASGRRTKANEHWVLFAEREVMAALSWLWDAQERLLSATPERKQRGAHV